MANEISRDELIAAIDKGIEVLIQNASKPPPILDSTSEGEVIHPYVCGGVKYITRSDAAKLLGVSTTTLWHWNSKGVLNAIKRGGRKVHYRYEDVLRIISG